jgi:general secretion pathway protein H
VIPARFRDASSLTGFTLIEIIIVLLIIGIATGLVGIVVSRNSGDREVRIFTKELSAVLRYARSHAVSEKRSYCFVIDREEGMYRLYVHDSGEEEEADTVISKSIPEEIEIIHSEDDEDVDIEFFPQGNSTGGVMQVARDGKVDFYITVNRITGRVEVENAE